MAEIAKKRKTNSAIKLRSKISVSKYYSDDNTTEERCLGIAIKMTGVNNDLLTFVFTNA